MSRHRPQPTPEVGWILAKHRRKGLFRPYCAQCGQTWRCRSRVYADRHMADIRRGMHPRVISLPIGHGTGTNGTVSNALGVFQARFGSAAVAAEATQELTAQRVSYLSPADSVLPADGDTSGARPMQIFGGRHARDKEESP